ncbi:hypothetical protein ZIOFF_044915 [Zingiber officinale]|uniref:MLLE-like domain-containing protein n=1 Tax=Zingiber officinale TaxID=94328 RepID=A0A8J5FW51_ZINOF|nr:hypothetical protein ZIOFF_044915 [Zingiber officinale]
MDRRTFGILCAMFPLLKIVKTIVGDVSSFDPQELEPLEEYDMEDEHFEDDEFVQSITPTEEWTNFRNTLTLEMMEQDQIVRGRGRNKCFWTENEVQVLIATLQDMACDPSWKIDGGFKSNYMAEVHKRMLSKIPTLTKQVTPHIESKIKWLKTRFHIINDMCRQSGYQWNDVEKKIACEKQWNRATGAVVQGYVNAIYNLEVDQNDESGGENLGAFYHSSNVYEEDNNMYFESESTPTALHNTDVPKSATKRKQPLTSGDKKRIYEKKMASERMKDVIAELMNLSLPSGDVFKAANIFTADKDKIDVLFNLPLELRRNYVGFDLKDALFTFERKRILATAKGAQGVSYAPTVAASSRRQAPPGASPSARPATDVDFLEDASAAPFSDAG